MKAVLAYPRLDPSGGTPLPLAWWDRALALGMGELGKPYDGPVVGRPEATRWGRPGYDCSSFVSDMVRKATGITLTAFTDAAYDQLEPTFEPLPGDVVFYRYADPSQPGVRYPHMGFWLSAEETLDCRYPGGVAVNPHVTGAALEVRTLPLHNRLDPWRWWSAETVAELARSPLDNVAYHWPRMYAALERRGAVGRKSCAAAIATCALETNWQFKPVREAYWLSEAWRAANLAYYPYYGRGEIQLTHRGNYERAGAALGINLVDNPDRALEPDIAAEVFGWYWTVERPVDWHAEHGSLTTVRALVQGGSAGLDDLQEITAALLAA